MRRSPMPDRRHPLRSRGARATQPESDDDDVCDSFLPADPDWPIARMVVLRRDRFTCCRCGQPGSDAHHRVALMMGGRLDDPRRHNPERLVCLCRQCHNWVHTHIAAARPAGYIIATADILDATTDDPLGDAAAAKPVRMIGGLMLLGKDGRMTPQIVRLGR